MRIIRKHLMLGYPGELSLSLRIFIFDMYVFVCWHLINVYVLY